MMIACKDKGSIKKNKNKKKVYECDHETKKKQQNVGSTERQQHIPNAAGR